MTLRIPGLASGVDTENIIKELLKTQQNKIDKKVKERTWLEWKRDDYRAVNTKLLALRTATADLKLDKTFKAKAAASSNESILTATAETTATPGSYNITVKQVAQKATMTSQSALNSNENISTVAAQFGIDEDAEINFTLAGANGETAFSFNAGDTSLSDIIDTINDEDMGISAYYDASVDRVFLMSTESGISGITVKMDGMRDSLGNTMVDTNGECVSFLEDYLKLNVNNSSLNEVSPASGHKIASSGALVIHDDANIILSEMYAGGTAPANVNFTLEGVTGSKAFTFATTITLDEMITQINNERSTTGVTATYNETTGKVIFSSSGEVTISGDTNNFLSEKLNMTIGSQEETLSSNSAVRIYDPANIKLNYLYTCSTPWSFTLEGGIGNSTFTRDSSSSSTQTLQSMIDLINAEYDNTGVTAAYNGETGTFSLMDSCPLASLETGSTATSATLAFNEALYSSSDGTSSGTLTALTNGQDITSRFTYTGAGTLTSATYNSDGTVDFVIAGGADGDTITLNGGTDSLFDAQGNQYLPVTMTYDGTGGEWTYEGRSNTDRKVAIRYDSEGFLADELNIYEYTMQGTKAIIDFNDAQNLEFDTNEITLMNSINLTLNAANPSQTVKVTVSNDIDGAVEKVKAWVEAYNTTLIYMNTELTERRYNNKEKYGGTYDPLTSDQKEEMTEDEIEKWEVKAKSGMLRGDSILFSAYSTTRVAAMDPVQKKSATYNFGLSADNPYSSLASIGITTQTYVQSSLEGGKLEIDESKLREALQDNPDQVSELFTLNEAVTDDEGEAVTDWNGDALYIQGIAYRLYDTVNDNMTKITEKAGVATSYVDTSLLTKEIGRINDRIEAYEDRMEEMEERYWDQFTAMEKMVSYYNSQAQWLSQQVAQLTASSDSSS